MVSLQPNHQSQTNPLDLLEELVFANDWPFDRSSDFELVVEIGGHWCDYHMGFVWQEEVGAIFFSCQLEQRIPDTRRDVVHALLAAVNQTLWLGHFDLSTEEAMLLFRHTIPLRGVPRASVELLEDLVDTALQECERFYPALQLVLWGGQTPGEALTVAMMDTVGEA